MTIKTHTETVLRLASAISRECGMVAAIDLVETFLVSMLVSTVHDDHTRSELVARHVVDAKLTTYAREQRDRVITNLVEAFECRPMETAR